jgi:hypothetical protein
MQKTLEEANIKLASVITDVMGLSGRRMIEATPRAGGMMFLADLRRMLPCDASRGSAPPGLFVDPLEICGNP